MTEETIFAAALEKKTPVERAAFLDETCSGDRALRQRVEALLQSHEYAGSFLKTPAILRAAEELAGQVPADTQAESPTGDHGDLHGSLHGDLDLAFLVSADETGFLRRLGHYEVHELIGRGGMAIVLKAFDEKLQRVVAIKVMAPQLAASALARQRFRREAQAAAAVRNEHIVAIYAVEEAEGLPYLVMEYVAGGSLQDRLGRSEPLELKHILSIGVQAAAGLAAAHALGLVHRDIKPSNILLENGASVKIVDFGLARTVDDGSVSQTGVIAGTPQYMAPEQARGDAFDHRADVYSLGATLYELLTRQPPFASGTPQQLLRQVAHDEPPRPRRINKAIPREVETIVLKAMAKEARDRYGTAQELAEDIGRFLEDKPIVAKRPALLKRLQKWARRHKAMVASVAVVAAVALLAGIVLAWRETQWANEAYEAALKQLNTEEQGRAAETHQRLRAEGNLRGALDVLDQIYLRVAEKEFLRDPQREKDDRELLTQALSFYEAFARENSAAPAARVEVGRAYHRVAEIRRALGQYLEARPAFGRAIAVREQLSAEFPTRADYKDQLAESHNGLGTVLRRVGHDQEAEKAYRKALELRSELAEADATVPDFQSNVAASLSNLAVLLTDRGQATDACQVLEQAIRHQRAALQVQPRHLLYREFLSNHYGALSMNLRALGKQEWARQAIGEAVTLLDELAAEFRDHPRYHAALASRQIDLGSSLADWGERAAADKILRRARDTLHRLVAQYPVVPLYRSQLALNYGSSAGLLAGADERAAAAEHFREAIDLLARLVNDFPQVPEYRQQLAMKHHNFGVALRRLGDPPGASRHLHQAIELRAQLVAEFPKVPVYRKELANSHNAMGALSGDPVVATKHFRQAFDLCNGLATEFPNVPAHQSELGATLNNWAIPLLGRGEAAEARQLLERAIRHQQVALEIDPQPPGYRQFLANHHCNLAKALVELGKHGEAKQAYDEGLKVHEKLATDFPNVPRYRRNLATAHYDLGIILTRMKLPADAEQAYGRALPYQEKLVADFPDMADYASELGATLNNLASRLRARRELTQARHLLELALRHQRAAFEMKPQHPAIRQRLSNHYLSLAGTLLQLEEHAEAAMVGAEFPRALTGAGAAEYHQAARVLAGCVPLAEKDKSLPPEKRKELTADYSDQATALLRQAIQRGYRKAEELRRDSAFEPLRSREGFQKLLADLETKAK